MTVIFPIAVLLERYCFMLAQKRADVNDRVCRSMWLVGSGRAGKAYLKACAEEMKPRLEVDDNNRRKIRLRTLVKSDPQWAVELLGMCTPAARFMSCAMEAAKLTRWGGLMVLGIMLAEYKISWQLTRKAAMEDLQALWDVCEQMRKVKVAKN